MEATIYPCIWCNAHAKASAEFYLSVFGDGRITADNGMVVMLELSGQKFMFLDGGDMFKVNPSISFYVTLETAEETDRVWNQLLDGGEVMMPLDKYDWSPKYGWLKDKYGVSWQLTQGAVAEVGQKFAPSLMFVGTRHGRAEEAIRYYTGVFPGSEIRGILYYTEGDGDKPGTVKHAQFTLGGYVMMAMESGHAHAFQFSEGTSFVIPCKDQAEIDRYWNELTSGGGEESRCGWLKDRFGVSWQVIPANITELLREPGRAKRVMAEVMKMNKLDMKVMENA